MIISLNNGAGDTFIWLNIRWAAFIDLHSRNKVDIPHSESIYCAQILRPVLGTKSQQYLHFLPKTSKICHVSGAGWSSLVVLQATVVAIGFSYLKPRFIGVFCYLTTE